MILLLINFAFVADYINEMKKSKDTMWFGNPVQNYTVEQMLKISPPEIVPMPLLILAHAAPFSSKTIKLKTVHFYYNKHCTAPFFQMATKCSSKSATI